MLGRVLLLPAFALSFPFKSSVRWCQTYILGFGLSTPNSYSRTTWAAIRTLIFAGLFVLFGSLSTRKSLAPFGHHRHPSVGFLQLYFFFVWGVVARTSYNNLKATLQHSFLNGENTGLLLLVFDILPNEWCSEKTTFSSVPLVWVHHWIHMPSRCVVLLCW